MLFPVNLKRQGNPYHAPFADLAVHLNGPLHLIHHFLHNGHTKPDALVISPCILVFLGKRLKNMLFELFSNANSGILDYKPIICNSTPAGTFLCMNSHRTMRTIIFEGIVDDIHQDLFQVQRISDQSAMLQTMLLKHQLNPVLRSLRGQNCNTVFQYIMHVKWFFHCRRSPALQPADLKNIVHQRQQMLGRYPDLLPALSLPLPVFLISLHHDQHSQNPIDGRTQIMRHMGKKFAF